MPLAIRPGDQDYNPIRAAHPWTKGLVAEVSGVFYRAAMDNDAMIFLPIEKKPERTSFHGKSKKHRGYYPPEHVQGPEGENA